MSKNEEIEMFGKMYVALSIIERCKEFASLIPEVRSNLVYAKEDARGIEDVLGIEGRISVRDGYPYACGKIKFGASSHMARLILEIKKIKPSIRAGINFACNKDIIDFLKEYSHEKGLIFSFIDRSKEPPEIREKEGLSMPWKIKEAIKNAGNKVPTIFYEKGGVGKEDLSVIVGEDPVEVAREICKIAKRFAEINQERNRVGKIDFDRFTNFVMKRLGKRKENIIVPPFTGIDAGVIDIGNDRVLIVAEDPIFSIPGQPPEMFGWYTVHIGASDVAVMGVKPEYMTYTLLMPPNTEDEVFERIIESIHRTATELDIAIVGGHTGFYPGLASPLIGGITVFSIAPKNGYVTSAGARPGDSVILTKGPAIETTGILAVLRERELLEKYPVELVNRAKKFCKKMTVVKDALIAMETGGVTSMHDATEGGVIGGLFEIANASNVGMEIDENKFIYPEEVKMVCEAFDIDPVFAIAEGSLLITAKPGYDERIIHRLKKEGIDASIIGKVTGDVERRILNRRNGTIINLHIPEQDPFWPVFFEALNV